MHIAVVGAGALGSVFGARLALIGRVRVTMVTRFSRPRTPILISRAHANHEEHAWAQPTWATSVPADTRVVVVCVRANQLDQGLFAQLAPAPTAPVIVLAPMLGPAHVRCHQALGHRLVATLPGIVAYRSDGGVVRYWLPQRAPTLLEEVPAHACANFELSRAFDGAGMRAHIARGVGGVAQATAVSLLALAMGITIAGGTDALLEDRALLQLTVRATSEVRRFSRGVGQTLEPVERMLRFVSPMTARIGVTAGRARWPEAVRYVDVRFSDRTASDETLFLAESVLGLARDSALACPALEALSSRMRRQADRVTS